MRWKDSCGVLAFENNLKLRAIMARMRHLYLSKQYVSRENCEDPCFAGVWGGIFGHGNLAGIVQALQHVLLTGLCVLLLGSHVSVLSLSITPPACGETTGRIERPSYRSAFIETNMVYSIYLPPCYDQSNTVYPSITLLHGSNDDDHHWLRLGLQTHLETRIMSGEMPPVIVILPFGNWIANQNQFGIASWENVFVGELMPLIEANYRVSTARAHRVIGGISRGGFWAFQIALRHPER
jgi:S-formylglutathione hydrolase FrmB